jgi:hypothetical protein
VEYTNSFSEVERKFAEGPRKKMLEDIPLWIKMLFVEKGMMRMELDRMVELTPLARGGGVGKDGGKLEREWIRRGGSINC